MINYLNSHFFMLRSISQRFLKVKQKTIIITIIITNKYYYSVTSLKI